MTPLTARPARFTRMLPLLAVCLPALALVPACGLGQDDEFRDGVPTSDAVALKVPAGQSTTQGALSAGTSADGTVTVRGALLGDQADLYKTTREVTSVINGGTLGVLTLVHTIVQFPPTDVSTDTAVWGPHSEPLSPNAWRLTVTRVAPGSFDYILAAKPKLAADSAFLSILSGHHNIVAGVHGRAIEGLGNGTFSVDWDAAQMLPEHDKIVGKADFTYARASFTSTASIGVVFTGVKDDNSTELYNADYQYAATPGAGGDFQYATHRDVLPGPGPTGSARELFTIHSRWLETGAGRADVQISGGESPSPSPVVNECWDASFASTFKNTSYDPTQTWGLESSCSFASASYSSLN
jgi:hypothetical protein